MYSLRRCVHPLLALFKCSVVNFTQSVMKWKCWHSALLSLTTFAVLVFVEELFSALYDALVSGPPAPDFVYDGKVAGYDPFALVGRMLILRIVL